MTAGRTIVFAAVLAACVSPAASAQNAPQVSDVDAARLVGAPWEFSNADRDKVCGVVFRTDRVPNGFKVDFEKACEDLFPIVRDIEAWRFAESDLLRLLDRNGKTLIEFGEVETGVFEAPTPGVGLLFLQAPGSDGPPLRSADDMFGDWVMTRAGKPVCSLTLSSSGAGDGYLVMLRPDCDDAIVRQGFASWKIDQGELLMSPARGAPWQFEEVDAANFRRVPDTTDITLTRQ